ncbi:response regulator [Candidatus Desantisbacteria bacterium]|nr:response regulator [Candidatus Desantisbacteria bacterium]
MKKILCVDDEPGILKVVEVVFQLEGFEVHTALSGYEMFEKLHSLTPDIILLDVLMPGMDGFEVCQKLKAEKETEQIPVVMFSVRCDIKDVERATQAGACRHIPKPVGMDNLVQQIKDVLKEMEQEP